MAKLGLAVLVVLAGVAVAWLVFWVLNKLTELLPRKAELKAKPYAFLLPAYTAIGLFLIYPAVTTIYASTLNNDLNKSVGLKNYQKLLHDQTFLSALINNVIWIAIAPAAIVAVGLLVASLTDRLSSTKERVAKSLIFLPMAISMVGASTIWSLMYAWRPAQSAQTGLLNEIVVKLGGEPQTWLLIETAKLNTLLLIVVYAWTQVGYAMVLLSAAIKGVPEDTIEAGRIDGASERKIFFRIIVPQAWPTVVTVFITVLIGVMKVFDIVYVMTNGVAKTNVIGNAFFNAMYTDIEPAKASAIVVVLMIAIIPVLVYQVRQFRIQEANR